MRSAARHSRKDGNRRRLSSTGIAGRAPIGCLVVLLIVPCVVADSTEHRTHSAHMAPIAEEPDEVFDAIARYAESVGRHLVTAAEYTLVALRRGDSPYRGARR